MYVDRGVRTNIWTRNVHVQDATLISRARLCSDWLLLRFTLNDITARTFTAAAL